MKKHFVRFYSPGTFMAETSEKELKAGWDIEEAKSMVPSIKERYGATPYGFCFFTRERGPDDLDSRITHTSHMYYLGGKVETLDEVKARGLADDRILISNMEGNGWDRVITNNNSWKTTRPLLADDVVLEWLPAAPTQET